MSKFSHIAGTFLIEANAGFLNGAGTGDGEDKTTTVPKTLMDNGKKVPYISAQAWRRWLRNTVIEETGWKKSELKAIDVNDRGNTNKIAGELDPVNCPEDDIFGYMRTIEKEIPKKLKDEEKKYKKYLETKGIESDEKYQLVVEGYERKIQFYKDIIAYNEENKNKKVKALIRTSPLMTSLLISLRKQGWRGKDEGFVHLNEGTPQPYSTEFYTSNLQGIFCLDLDRLGVYKNMGDRVELDQVKINAFLEQGKISKKVVDEKKGWEEYELTNNDQHKKERAGELLKALSVLRGGAKQTAFLTDLSPKAVVLAGLDSGNVIFNSLFEEEYKSALKFKTEVFKEIVKDYKDRIKGKVYIGIRKGYISNENEIHELMQDDEFKSIVEVHSPIEAIKKFNKTELNYPAGNV